MKIKSEARILSSVDSLGRFLFMFPYNLDLTFSLNSGAVSAGWGNTADALERKCVCSSSANASEDMKYWEKWTLNRTTL